LLTRSPDLGFSLISTVFLAASLVLLWFVILSGVTHTSPLRQTYFLRADTNGITGARPITQWTYFYICGLDNENVRADANPPAAAPGVSGP
jgi:hypothetical protein